jgi:biopolymer transport protein TolQ
MTTPVEAATLNPVELFMAADWVVKAIMVGLAVASVWSWTVIIDKAFRFAALNRQADSFETAVNSGRSLEDIATQAGPNPHHALPRMLVLAITDWRDARKGGVLSEGQANLLIARIDRALDSLIAREGQRIENGLGVLSVVATASPFIGLFGTVWGIMNAFAAIGSAVAIPAYMAYNKFSIDAGKFTGRLESFADDLQAAVARRLSSPSSDTRREV